MEKTDFRKQLKELVNESGISIAKLARKADLNAGTVYNYLNGISDITAINLAKLYDVLYNMK